MIGWLRRWFNRDALDEELDEELRSHLELREARNRTEGVPDPRNPARLTCGRVEANFLDVLRVPPLLGRNFTVGEDSATGPRIGIDGCPLQHRCSVLGPSRSGGARRSRHLSILP